MIRHREAVSLIPHSLENTQARRILLKVHRLRSRLGVDMLVLLGKANDGYVVRAPLATRVQGGPQLPTSPVHEYQRRA